MNKREKMIYDILFGFLFVTTIYNTWKVTEVDKILSNEIADMKKKISDLNVKQK